MIKKRVVHNKGKRKDNYEPLKIVSEKLTGIKRSNTTKNKIRLSSLGKKHSIETKIILSEKGKIHNKGKSNPMYGKIGENNPNYNKGLKNIKWKIIHPDGKEIFTNCLTSFCRDYEENTGIKLYQSNFQHIVSGRIKQYKGFKCERLENM